MVFYSSVDQNRTMCSNPWKKAVNSNLSAIGMHLKAVEIEKAEKIWRSLLWHARKEAKRRKEEDAVQERETAQIFACQAP